MRPAERPVHDRVPERTERTERDRPSQPAVPAVRASTALSGVEENELDIPTFLRQPPRTSLE
jgi:hypothetical protein